MANTQSFTIKKFVSPLESAVRSDAQSSLGSVLSRVRSSHEAVFVFDDKNGFLGLISPFQTLYSHNYPYTTKVSSIVFRPPAITEETPVYEAANHMLAARLYMLPVFDNEGLLQGVIYGKDMFQEIIRDPGLLEFVSRNVHLQIPITAPITSSARDIFHTLKERGTARMIVVDAKGSLAGIVTRSDLMHTLIKPTSKTRFPKEGTQIGYYSLAGEKKFRKEESIRKYYTSFVDTLPDNTPKEKIIKYFIASPYNSVVLINEHNKPTGLLSARAILEALALLRPEEGVPLIIKRPSKSVTGQEFERAVEYLERFGKKLRKRMEIKKIEVATKEPKNPKGRTKAFNTSVIVTPVAGKAFVAVAKRRNFMRGIQEATALIEKQRRRSGVSKEKTKQALP